MISPDDLVLLNEWKALVKDLNEKFGANFDLDGIIFLVGVQELGKGYVELSKDQKMEVFHIGICKLLSRFGFYEYTGMDSDGWPHYQATKRLPHLSAGQQNKLVKKAILEYFKDQPS